MAGGSSQPQQVTQTQTTNPPDYAIPFFQRGAQAALNEASRPMEYYSGQTVNPFSSQTEQALQGTEARAMGGSPVTRAAQGYTADVLGGKYLNSNPYIDQTFNQAAQGTRSQLDSQFASSGRSYGAQSAARGDQLNNLASQIYGGNYANERALMNSTLGQANSIANQDYTDLGQLAQAGAQREDLSGRQIADNVARHDFAQNAPGIALDQYISRINNQPGGSSTSSTPYFTNRGAGALGGASAGYGLGNQFGYGGLGALLGGVLGGYG